MQQPVFLAAEPELRELPQQEVAREGEEGALFFAVAPACCVAVPLLECYPAIFRYFASAHGKQKQDGSAAKRSRQYGAAVPGEK